MIIPEDNLEMNKGDPGKTWDLINKRADITQMWKKSKHLRNYD